MKYKIDCKFKKHRWLLIGLASSVIVAASLLGICCTKQNTNNQPKVEQLHHSWMTKASENNESSNTRPPLIHHDAFDEDESPKLEGEFEQLATNFSVNYHYQPATWELARLFPKEHLQRFTNYVKSGLKVNLMRNPGLEELVRFTCSFDLIGEKITLNYVKLAYNSSKRDFDPYFDIKHTLWLVPENEGENVGKYKSVINKNIKDWKPEVIEDYLTFSGLEHLYKNMIFTFPEYTLDPYNENLFVRQRNKPVSKIKPVRIGINNH